MKLVHLLGLAIITLCSGCSSLLAHGGHNGSYCGVRMDAAIITRPEDQNPMLSGPPYGFFVAYALIDFPFSAVGDTLLLPFDLMSSE